MKKIAYISATNGLGKLPWYDAEKDKDFEQLIGGNQQEINALIHQHGGVLLRNCPITSVLQFKNLAQILSPILLDYHHRSTPRSMIINNVYTSTAYPEHKHIHFHNECSYASSWPERLFLFCLVPPTTGGETPIADSRCVLNQLNESWVKKFQTKNILYTKRYWRGIDLSWQEVFQTTLKTDVELYCEQNDITYFWGDTESDLELTTQHICLAIQRHPITTEEVWFNQAHLFHHAGLEPGDRAVLQSILEPGLWPRHAAYGDGGEIDEEVIRHVHQVYLAEKILFQWQKGDFLILDNLLMAHARHPFTGPRQIVVAMGRNSASMLE